MMEFISRIGSAMADIWRMLTNGDCVRDCCRLCIDFERNNEIRANDDNNLNFNSKTYEQIETEPAIYDNEIPLSEKFVFVEHNNELMKVLSLTSISYYGQDDVFKSCLNNSKNFDSSDNGCCDDYVKDIISKISQDVHDYVKIDLNKISLEDFLLYFSYQQKLKEEGLIDNAHTLWDLLEFAYDDNRNVLSLNNIPITQHNATFCEYVLNFAKTLGLTAFVTDRKVMTFMRTKQINNNPTKLFDLNNSSSIITSKKHEK